jgi:ATP-dependent Lon protease
MAENSGDANGASDAPRIPGLLPVLALRDIVAFPDAVLPLTVGREKSVHLVDDVLLGDKIIALVTQREPETEDPTPDDIYRFGVAGIILKMVKFPDHTSRILVQGIGRIELGEMQKTEPYMVAEAAPRPDIFEESTDMRALVASVVSQFVQLVTLIPNAPEEMKVAAMNIQPPGRLADFIVSHLNLKTLERQEFLETLSVRSRLEKLSQTLGRELEVAELGQKIQSSVQERVEKGQREFFLREQLRAIKRELGEEEEGTADVAEFREKIEAAGMPDEAENEAQKELDRLARMNPQSAEYSVIATYLDWLTALPWQEMSEDNLDVMAVREVLDADHWDLEKVKDRMVEYVAVRKLKPEGKGPILCFVGPPGVGKTSLGQSIARALGRRFVRMSLGGVRDEAEIRGHRRTYVGALPGKIIQAIRRTGSRNPVMMLDEVDKLGVDFRGDPSSALLEVLDPEQNHSFTDHYLAVAFDLSSVIFIVTANMLETIPPALRDRLEVLTLPGYSEEEKLEIGRRHLIPRQLEAHGIDDGNVTFEESAITGIIRSYAREAGVRNLEREIANVCRKVAVEVASGKTEVAAKVTGEDLRSYLGPPKQYVEVAERTSVPGVAVGLAWTAAGGEILFVESTRMRGRGDLTLTGHLGEVMQESARTALSIIRSRAEQLGVAAVAFAKEDLHIHVPEGATPKDGPSAGVAVVASLFSIYTGLPVRPDTAMTGEITLRGKVLPVGGIKEKVLAARRAGIGRVLLPDWNRNDCEEIPEAHRKGLEFVFIKTIEDVIEHAFSARPGKSGSAGAPLRGATAAAPEAAAPEPAKRIARGKRGGPAARVRGPGRKES